MIDLCQTFKKEYLSRLIKYFNIKIIKLSIKKKDSLDHIIFMVRMILQLQFLVMNKAMNQSNPTLLSKKILTFEHFIYQTDIISFISYYYQNDIIRTDIISFKYFDMFYPLF